MKGLQSDSTVHLDSDLSTVLNLSVKFIFILMWPAAVVVGHDAVCIVIEKKQSLITPVQKIFSLFEKDAVYML